MLGLLLTSSIFATVVNAQEGRGSIIGVVTLEGSGKPVADAELQLTFGSKSSSRRSGPDGKFQFSELLPGKYTIRIIPPDGTRAMGDSTAAVTIGDGSSSKRVDFTLSPRATPAPRAAAMVTPEPTPKVSPTLSPAPVIGSPLSSLSPRPPTPSARPTVSPIAFDFGPSGLRMTSSPTAAPSTTPPTTATGTVTPTPVASGPPQRLVTSFAQLRDAAGASAASQLNATATDTSFVLRVPFRTQIDGTAFSLVNCGPASLAMVLAAFGLDIDPPSLRDYVNRLIGNYDTEQGTSLSTLAQIAQEAGLNVFGPSGRGAYQAWTIDALRDQIRAGHPVITLTKYRRLPGHFGSVTDFDHYVVITGLAGEDFVYNDAAYSTEYGYNLLITPAQLEQAWAASSIPRHAIAIGLGDGLRPLPTVPNRLVAASLAAPPEIAESKPVSVPIRPVRGPATERLREQALEDLGARSAVVDGLETPTSEYPPAVVADQARSDQRQFTISSEQAGAPLRGEQGRSADADRATRIGDAPQAVARNRGVPVSRRPEASAWNLVAAVGSVPLILGGATFIHRRRRRSGHRAQSSAPTLSSGIARSATDD